MSGHQFSSDGQVHTFIIVLVPTSQSLYRNVSHHQVSVAGLSLSFKCTVSGLFFDFTPVHRTPGPYDDRRTQLMYPVLN